MSPDPRSTKWQQVVLWLQQQKTTTGRLPSMREVALNCGVSIATVQMAVRFLKKEGWLLTQPGGGLWKTEGGIPFPLETPPSPRHWERVLEQLVADLREGELPQGPRLPSAKWLADRMGCSQPTLRKVLAMLGKQGLITREGNGWVVSSQKSTTDNQRLTRYLWVVAGSVEGRIRVETSREIEFFRCIEEECYARNLELKFIGFDEKQGGFLPLIPRVDANVVGVLFSPWHLVDPLPCLRQLAAWKCPISIWLEVSRQQTWVHHYVHRKGFALFSVGHGMEPGRSVGHFLAKQGHTRVAYISPFHGSGWSRDRLQGLEAVLPHVVACTHPQYLNTWTFRDAVESSPLGQARPEELLPPSLKSRICPENAEVLGSWREHTCELARDLDIQNVLNPLLELAVEAECTAWAFANDLSANLA